MTDLKEFKLGFDYIAKTSAGLEEILLKELIEIGADDASIIKRGVSFRGDTSVLFKANYLSRTAIRIIKPIGVFEVSDDKQLYEKVKKINWEDVFNLEQTFKVNAHVYNSELDHSQFVALRTKDAIVDQFRDKTGKRPWVEIDNADIYIDVHINDNVCTISLDSSGESLHKRGYRIDADKAPINEVLAAGMIGLTGWNGEKDFYDPMCGSGTIAIEAAMKAMKIPAGYYRDRFAFMNWEGFDESLWENIKREANEKIIELECTIYASDRSKKAVNIAKTNLKNAALHKDIDLGVNYFDAIVPEKQEGILVFNPPYGMRLEEINEINDLYSSIGDTLKKNFSGFEAWIITANMDAAKHIGLRTSARIELYNGPLESRLLKYELYQGTKKDKSGDTRRPEGEWKKDRSQKPGDRKRSSGEDSTEWRDEGVKRSFKRQEEGQFKRPFKEKREDDWRKEKGDKGKKFGRNEEKKPYRKSEKPSWKDTEEKGAFRKAEGRKFKNPFKEKKEDDWRKDKGERGTKFGKDEERKPFKLPDKPKWKGNDDKSEGRKRDEELFKKPQLGKPKKTEYTGDGKKGSRKKRPRLK